MRIVRIVLIAIAVLLVLSPRVSEAQGLSIEGTWRVLVTPDAGGPPPSWSYHPYLVGGGLLQSNLTEGAIPAHRSWTAQSRDRYLFTFEKFVGFNPILGQTGVYVFKVREVVEVRNDGYVGRAEASFCDAAGGACVTAGAATTQARKMMVESPTAEAIDPRLGPPREPARRPGGR
jgi:hypothetical protein